MCKSTNDNPTYNLYRDYIKNNIPLLLLGKSGTGKSQIIQSIAQSLNLPVVDLRLSQLPPEDLNGLPAPATNTNTPNTPSFGYLTPEWFAKFLPDTPFVLFLDEINQATPATLNALYGIVLDRKVGAYYNPNMRVVAAGNLLSESDYISELPQPLLNRFVVKTHVVNPKTVISYLQEKYADNKKAMTLLSNMPTDWESTLNPRALERIINISCVCGIDDNDEIRTQCGNDTPLAEQIIDLLKNGAIEHCDESSTAELIKKAIAGEKNDLPDEIKEIME